MNTLQEQYEGETGEQAYLENLYTHGGDFATVMYAEWLESKINSKTLDKLYDLLYNV